MSMAALCSAIESVIDNIPETSRCGYVLQSVGLTIEATLPGAFIGELCELSDPNRAEQAVLAEVVGFRDDRILLMPYQSTLGIHHSTQVKGTGSYAGISTTNKHLGHVLNGFGEPLDNPSFKHKANRKPVRHSIVNPMSREPISEVMSTGIRAIDGLLTMGKGQRLGLLAGSGVGKSTLLSSICQHSEADVNVVALIGERGREVEEFVNHTLGSEGLAKSVVIAATAQESPLMRVQAARAAMAYAEHFAQQGKNVFFMVDSITRYAMALREIGLAVGEPPTVKGYTPSVFTELPYYIERCGNFRNSGSITGLFSVLVESDDFTDPVVDSVRAILDGHIVLSREYAERNHYPAIDVLKSISRIYTKLNNDGIKQVARSLRQRISDYEQNRDILELGLFDSEGSEQRKTLLEAWQHIKSFLVQDTDNADSLESCREQLFKLGELIDVTRKD
ncbi:FliI/YscN family ATPase [Paraneptunicella aestuarii]|uniref:FliI/YscN family ATPase n=1 Tax=Paraneptunicella aestuarii TaxID=2831148 RepID=UPI001E2935C1|nr:FliI/YscN family ATPase [Paraneptunicella aestuarii]UAA37589.1 FliI/YscN family ATPase [Paraneptunicella aestuarii]